MILKCDVFEQKSKVILLFHAYIAADIKIIKLTQMPPQAITSEAFTPFIS